MNKKAFTLIELMVGMGIVAVLMVLAITGIISINKSSRDSQRLSALSNIAKEVNNFRVTNLRYPEITTDLVFQGESVRVGTKEVELKGSSRQASSTSTSATKYLYQTQDGGFMLCALMESGKVESAGNVTCPSSI